MPAIDSPQSFASVGSNRIAYRRVGSGDALLLVHGWPLNGHTWRHLLPALSEHFTCIVPDLLGAGDTEWTGKTDFTFRGQAATLQKLIDGLGLTSYSILAHDTGGTISRQLALIDGTRVKRLTLIDTEIPFHRPPWVVPFQKMSYLPGSNLSFRTLVRSRWFRRSSMGLGGLFCDRALLDGEFHELFIAPLIASSHRMEGQIHYLRGIDWDLVDGLAARHREITVPVQLIWGEDDHVFPIERGREIVTQLANCVGLTPIAGAALLPHEEQPKLVMDAVLPFLRGERE